MGISSPEPPNQIPAEPSSDRVFRSITRVGAVVAAFTGGVVGLVAFFNLGSEVVLPSLYLAALLILSYLALANKRAWIRAGSLSVFAVVGMLAVILYYVFLWPRLILFRFYGISVSPTIALLSFAAEFIMFGYLASTARGRSLRVLYWSIVAILVCVVIAGETVVAHLKWD